MMAKRATLSLSLLGSAVAFAAEPKAAAALAAPSLPGVNASGSLFTMLAVILLAAAALWFMRRLRMGGVAGQAGVEVVAQIPLGVKERLLVLQVGNQRLLVACSGSGMQTLHQWDDDGSARQAAQTPPVIPGFAGILAAKLASARGGATATAANDGASS